MSAPPAAAPQATAPHVPVPRATETHHGAQRLAAEAQDRLLLALRALHGPGLPALWSRVCTRAQVVGTGRLSLDELERVAAVLLTEGRQDAVAARSCRIRLLFARTRSAAAPPAPEDAAAAPAAPEDAAAPDDVELRDDDVRRALAQPEALAPDAWARRLAELEHELAHA